MEGSPLHILLVEDNPDHAEMIIRKLRAFNFANSMTHVDNGEDALNYLFRKGEYEDKAKYPCPDLVLLDLRLPKVDGLEVLKRIKSEPKLNKIPVVVLTTSKADQDLEKAYEYHANSYLVKPVEFEDFAKMLKDLGYYWLGWNTKPAYDL